jgi:hypothetical protein
MVLFLNGTINMGVWKNMIKQEEIIKVSTILKQAKRLKVNEIPIGQLQNFPS